MKSDRGGEKKKTALVGAPNRRASEEGCDCPPGPLGHKARISIYPPATIASRVISLPGIVFLGRDRSHAERMDCHLVRGRDLGKRSQALSSRLLINE